MKTINHKLTFLLLLTSVLLSGCLPDSLTKFKKESAKPAAPYVDPGVVVTDSAGKTVDSSTITYPTSFYYRRNSNAITAFYANVGQEYLNTYLNYIIDGTLGNETNKSLIFLRCELDVDLTDGTVLNDTLPPGLELDQSTCTFKGEPLNIYSDTALATYGQGLNYKTKLYFKNAKNLSAGTHGAVTCTSTECYIKSSNLKIAAYKAPQLLKYTQNDKLGLYLENIVASMNVWSVFDNSTSTRTDNATSSTGSMGAIKIVNIDKNILYIQRAIPITLASLSGFSVGSTIATYDTLTVSSTAGLTVGDTIVTSGGYTGTLSSISGLVLRVVRASTSGTTIGANVTNNGANISASSLVTKPVYGVVLSIDTATNIIRATQDPAYAGTFEIYSSSVAGNSGIVTALGQSSVTTISALDSEDGFRKSQGVDNDTQFYSAEANLKTPVQYYKVGTVIETIKPIITNDTVARENGVVYSVFPALPTGLAFDTTTGYITGTLVSTLDPTEFTVTATNALTSASTVIRIAAIYEPKDLSYTRMEVIPVLNAGSYPNAIFNEGDKIFQPIVAPATISVSGRVKRKFSDSTTIPGRTLSMLEITTNNGDFDPAASIDNGRSYISEKAYISSTDTVYNYNLVLYLTAPATMSNFTIGSYVTNSVTAKARITYIDTVRKALYVQYLTPNLSNIQVFKEGDTITNSVSAGTAVIDRVEAERYRLTLTGMPVDIETSEFTTGMDITASNGTSKVGGYIYNYDNTNAYVYVDDITHTPGVVNQYNVVTTQYPEFKTAQEVTSKERFAATGITINEVTFDNLIVANRGEPIKLRSNVSQGSTLNFSISPALPAGLSLETLTGTIHGTPTYQTPRKTYVVTASNLLGSTSYQFDLEIRDYFKITEVGDSTSFQFHKVGDTQNIRECKVNATDIKNENGLRDVRCYLDGQEEDFYTNKLRFRPSVGSGVCEYLQYAPFSFQKFPVVPKSDDPLDNGSYTIDYVAGCTKNADNSAASWLPKYCEITTYTDRASCEADAGNLTWFDVTEKCIDLAQTQVQCVDAGESWSTNLVTKQPGASGFLYCPANYTGWLDTKHPNCDEDTFRYMTYTSALDATSGKCLLQSASPTFVKCGGNVNACMTGPVLDILSDNQIKANMRSIIYPMSSGSEFNIIHKAPTEFSDFSNLRVVTGITKNATTTANADFDAWTNHIGNLTSVARSNLVQKYRRAAYQQNPFVNGVPAYIFNCLDAAHDIKARIRVTVRDWDRSFKITDNIDADSPSSGSCSLTPLTTSTACTGGGGTWTPRLNTNGTLDSFGVSYNMFDDWDDDYTSAINSITDGAQANYTTGTCSNAAYNNQFVNCITNSGTWTPTTDFAFPGDEL